MFTALNRKIKRMVLHQQKKRKLVRISDTTLRDGCQTPGLRLDTSQKVTIAQAMAEAGVHSIDCGFPAAGIHEVESIRRIASAVRGPILSAHARTTVEDIKMASEALRGVSPLRKAITLFIGLSPLHREHKHRMSKSEIIKTLVKCIQFAQGEFEIISFGPEDASRTEPEFLHQCYEEAIQAGAVSIGFTDTVGILTPGKVTDAVKRIQDSVRSISDAMIAVHFHNDLGLATANSLAAVKAGANIVQGTVNGIGERAGNTAIEEVVVALTLHRDEFGVDVTVDPKHLANLSKLVTRLTRFEPAPNKPVVGRNLFRTEAGVHQSAVLNNPDTYLPFKPELIGAGPVELVLGPNSGRSAVRHHLKSIGVEVSEEEIGQVLDALKRGPEAPSENAEVRDFLQRLRPFMGVADLQPAPAADSAA